MNKIVEIQLEQLKSIILSQNILLKYDEKAVNYLASKGYDPAFGARPLKRVIQREVQNMLAKDLLSGKYSSGQTINLSANEQGLVVFV